MELRTEESQRFHIQDVIRTYPNKVTQPAIRPAVEDTRMKVPGTDGIEPQEGRLLVGYPVVFNQWTEIYSWDGPFLERIDPAAADKTLSKRADKIQFMFNHGFDFMLEQTAIGKHLDMTPDDDGVWVESALIDRGVYPKIDLIVELIRWQAIWGQSFRFKVDAESWIDEPDPSDHNPKGLPERTITEFTWFEDGPVTYPAYEATTVMLRDDGHLTVPVRSRRAFQAWCEGRSIPALEDQLAEHRKRRSPKLILRSRANRVPTLSRFLEQSA